MTTDRRASRSLSRVVLAIALPALALLLGNLATMPNISSWYSGLNKPWFNPPSAVFGPVWTLLYISMGVAFWRVLAPNPARAPLRREAIAAFCVQMALNAAWSWAFFAARSPLFGLLVIGALVVAISVTIALFWRLDKPAAIMLIPYWLWVAFATVLNAAIWRLNP